MRGVGRHGYWFALAVAALAVAFSDHVAESAAIADARLGAVLEAGLRPSWVEAVRRAAMPWLTWPVGLTALAAGGLLAGLAGRWQASSLLATLLVVGGGLAFTPDRLLLVILLAIAVGLESRWPTAGLALPLLARGMLLGAAYVLTADPGLLALVYLLRDAAALVQREPRLDVAEHSSARDCQLKRAALTAVMLVLTAVVVPDVGRTLARPVSWVTLAAATELFPDISPPLADPWRAGDLLLALFLVGAGLRLVGSPGPTPPPLMIVFPMIVLGLACRHYLLPAAWVIAWTAARSPQDRPANGPHRTGHVLLQAVVWGGLAYGLLDPLPRASEALRSGRWPIAQVSPLHFGSRGPAILLDLSHARDWQTQDVATAFPLALADRWEVPGATLRSYQHWCYDLEQLRRDIYWREDGGWGGYFQQQTQVKAALLVVPSERLESIRRLSLSPDWRLLSLDPRRVIFGWAADRALTPQAMRAAQQINRWEWSTPAGVPVTFDPRVAAAVTPSERRKLALVLAALRLPYAGLALVREDSSRAADGVRAWCYLELADRLDRYGGVRSVLDVPRAEAGLRRLRGHWLTPPATRARADRALKELARRTALAIDPIPAWAAEWTRRAEQPPAERRAWLQDLANQPNWSPGERGVLHFYLAGLALEVGDQTGARNHLLTSEQLTPAWPGAPLRRFYLQQLQATR